MRVTTRRNTRTHAHEHAHAPRVHRARELYTDTRIMPDPDRLGVDYDSKEIRIPRNDLIRDRRERELS